MTWRRAGELALIVLVFVVVGPLIGLAVMALGMSTAGWPSAPDAVAMAAFVGLFGLVFAHYMGLVPALVAAVAVAGYAFVRGKVPLWWAMLAGIAGMIVFGGFGPLAGLEDQVFKRAMQTALPFVSVVPAVACTWLTRRWQ